MSRLELLVRTPWVAGALAVACGGGDPSGVTERPPAITVVGVEEGGRYLEPVTITITVDRGTYDARLNGASFVSGSTVATPGSYELVVMARAGALTAEERVPFDLVVGGSSVLIIRVLDLGPNDAGGGGDAVLLTDSSAAGLVHALIDAGPAGVGGSDPGYVAGRLASLGVDSLAALILTHAHSDHFAGLAAVLDAVVVRRFYYNGQVRDLAPYNAVLQLASDRADSVIVPAAVLTLPLGRDTVTTALAILPPLPDSLGHAQAGSSALNDGSLGAALRRGTFTMFLAGDGEVQANLRWRTQFAAYTASVEVLKVGHHGANDAIFDNGCCGESVWLQHTAPAVAVVSANGTTHPRINAVSQLTLDPSRRTLCTSVHGAIEIRVDPAGRYRVDLSRNVALPCRPGSQADS